MAKAATLVDTFDTQSAQWSGWGANVAVSGGQLTFPGQWTDLVTATSDWDLTSSQYSVQVVTPTEARMEVWTPASDRLLMLEGGGTVYCQVYLSNVFSSSDTFTYSAGTDGWWRITADATGTTVTWETSPDGSTWTTRNTRTGLTFGAPLTACQLWLSSGAGSPVFDNVGGPAVVAPATPARPVVAPSAAAVRAAAW